ncbi:MAG: hypothetical protein QOH70_1959 [Blastocatellia bacterium]|jgi:hypothetical protein|nr:hypothetical protein [Blastocatellia bacterium]
MELTILIVGRGTAPGVQTSNGHSLEFRASARTASGILSLDTYDFVFQHLGPANPEALESINEWTAKGWRKKIVAFSGGAVPKNIKDLDVSLIEGLPGRLSILDLAWSAVPSNFSGDARELLLLLKPSRPEFLSALAILCQGYLAVRSHKNETDAKNAEAQEALSEMGFDKIEGHVRDELVNVEDVLVPVWWRRVFAGQRGEMEKAISHEWGVHSISDCPPAIGDLIVSIYSDQPIGAKVVGGAYLAIAKRLRN